MNLKAVTYREVPDIREINHELDRLYVLVEWRRAISLKRIVKVYIPAYVWKQNDMVIVCYEHHPKGSYDPYLVKSAYNESNMPDLYEFTSIGIREALSISYGYLLGYDEESDCFRPFAYKDEDGKEKYAKWYDVPELRDKWKIWTEC